MKTNTLLTHLAASAATAALCLALPRTTAPKMLPPHPGNVDTPIHSQARHGSDPLSVVPRSPVRATAAGPVRPDELGSFLSTLTTSGMSGNAIVAAALDLIEQRGGPLSAEDRLQTEEYLENQLLGIGIRLPIHDWDTRLELGFEADRRKQIAEGLASFDDRMRELLRAHANGAVAEEDFAARYAQLKREREQALFRVLSPEETRRWVALDSPQAKALRELPPVFTSSEIEQIAVARHEAAGRLAVPDLTESGRRQIEAELDSFISQSLGESAVIRLRRAEDPVYSAFFELTGKLNLPVAVADCIFDWQRHVADCEERFRKGGLEESQVRERMLPVLAQAAAAMKEMLGDGRFEQFRQMPEATFLTVIAGDEAE